MPFVDYLITPFWVALGVFLVWGLSVPLLWASVPAVPRLAAALAVLGFQTSFMYLKPAGLSVGWAIILPILISYFLFQRAKTPVHRYREFFSPLKEAPVLLILLYSFSVFLFRWDPPGSDPVKWGSFARLLLETGSLAGETWPLSSVHDLKGMNHGLPVAIALVRWASRAPWERVIFFLESLSLAGFVFSWALVLRSYFSSTSSLWASLAGLVIFTNPQQYLNWGGTPTLVGMISAPILFAAMQTLSSGTKFSPIEMGAFAFALAGGAHAHPIGIYLSLLVLSPWFLTTLIRSSHKLNILGSASMLGALSLFAFSPFLLKWGLDTSGAEFGIIKKWQASMAPYLFREDHLLLYNLYTQIAAYLWSTAFVLVLFLALTAWIANRKSLREWGNPLVLTLILCFALVANTLNWRWPLSFLIYPERVTTVLALVLLFPIAYWLDVIRGRKAFQIAAVVLLVGLGATQFHARLWPSFGHSVFTPQDKVALSKVTEEVPPGECVRITFLEAGMWIPVLSLRCTVPYHVMSPSTEDEQINQEKGPLRFEYVSPGKRPKTDIESWLIDEEDARLGKVKLQ